MGLAKRMLEEGYGNNGKGFWFIQKKRRVNGEWIVIEANPFIGYRVRITWGKKWGGKLPGFMIEGILEDTRAVNGGRTMIGIIRRDNGRTQQFPCSGRWARNGWIKAEILATPDSF